MRFKVFVAAAAALVLAFAAPAHAEKFAHTRNISGGAGSGWSSSSDITPDGAFSVAAAVKNVDSALGTLLPPTASADAMAGNDGTLPAGTYDITTVVKDVDADATGTTPEAWAAVTLTLTIHCAECRSTSVNSYATVVETGTGTTSVRDATVRVTTRVVLLEPGYLAPFATLTAEAAGGTRLVVDPVTAKLSGQSGDASATATGVIDSVTVTPVEGTPPPLPNVSA